MNEMSVREWQERFRAGDFSSRDRAVQCEAGWYDCCLLYTSPSPRDCS